MYLENYKDDCVDFVSFRDEINDRIVFKKHKGLNHYRFIYRFNPHSEFNKDNALKNVEKLELLNKLILELGVIDFNIVKLNY